ITNSNKANILATPYVDASEKIYDFADILTDQEEEYLYKLIQEYINTTNMDMVILTDTKSYYADSQNETYAADFYDYNDFGLDLENYSGVLLYRNAYEVDPYYNVYMFGNAQLYYDYNRSEAMLDAIYSDMRGKNYLAAFEEFIDIYTEYYEDGIPSSMKDYGIDSMGFMYKKYAYPWSWALLVSCIVAFIYAAVFIGRNKMVKKAREAKDYLNEEDVDMYRVVDQYVRSHTSSYTVSSSSGSSGGGGHSSGGSSGMGHSSGGGRHG
ncbi:MAG: TPM domain-containing protein, partial [Bacilli bacterium]|nr:TPM domain-containing protein [Bacilli bacterium]